MFTPREYRDPDARPTLDEAWDRLPVVRRVGGLRLRWLGPLVELGHDDWIEELGQGAWGYLEGCGWQSAIDEGGEMLDRGGRVRARWRRALVAAVDLLADAGTNSGPEGDRDRWASWVAFQLSEPHEWLRATAEKRGWER